MAFITMGDGCRIAYRFDGPQEAPVLLLSNSLGTDMSMWNAQIDAFSAKFRLLRYDQRGHGASDAPVGAYSLDRLGRDVVELLDGLKLDKVHFCGLSLGGMTGQWLGIYAPERLNGLILANTSSYMGPPTGWDSRIVAVHNKGMAPLAQASVERWFTSEFAAKAPEDIQAIVAKLTTTNPVGYAGCCAAIRDMDLRPVVQLVAKPALIIGGSKDPSTPPAHSEALAQAIDGASLVMLDAAHLSNVEQPEAFSQSVLNYLL
jgi:3-oxoadipate enol-lactonase